VRRAGILAALLVATLAGPALAQDAAPPGRIPDAVPTPDPEQAVANAGRVVGPPRGAPLGGPALDAEAKRISLLLRCPVCQGLSAEESPSGMAQNMRAQVRELVATGYDEEQVLRYFERSYGEFVRLEPPMRGVNWIVWLAPLGGLIAGGLIVALVLRRPRASASPDATSCGAPSTVGVGEAAAAPREDVLPEDPQLATYVLRVRELAYGWPGGVRPGTRQA
jgi:cytochrome c-type biogenesis protein CcmH